MFAVSDACIFTLPTLSYEFVLSSVRPWPDNDDFHRLIRSEFSASGVQRQVGRLPSFSVSVEAVRIQP